MYASLSCKTEKDTIMKFNFINKGKDTTVNYMGARAYKMTPEMELYSTVVTCVVDDSYYESNADRINRIKNLISKCRPEFVAKLAVYARTEMNLRSVPVILVVELARLYSGNEVVKRAVSGIVRRADEITEVLAYYQVANGREGTKKLNRLSKQVQKGLIESFNQFDEYQFAKYNRETAVSLRDALFLVHPKAKDEAQQAIFDRIVSGSLATPYTWETELSELGKMSFGNEKVRAMAVSEKWEELLASGKLGYMAILRNLRNIVMKSSSVALDIALDVLTDKNRIRRSKQMPFRYLSAFLEINKLTKESSMFEEEKAKIKRTLSALEQALVTSCDNIPVCGGKTVILSDNSGSMYGDRGGKSLVSAMSERKSADIANLFAVLYWNRCKDTYVGLFGDRLVDAGLDRSVNVFENFNIINRAAKKCGPSTERGIFDYMESLIKSKKIVDRIVIFSDCQVGTGCNWYDSKGHRGDYFNRLFQKYLQINPAVKIYTIDLRGYGNSMTKDDGNVILVSGWSEKIFDMIYYIEQGSSVVNEIMKIELQKNQATQKECVPGC